MEVYQNYSEFYHSLSKVMDMIAELWCCVGLKMLSEVNKEYQVVIFQVIRREIWVMEILEWMDGDFHKEIWTIRGYW
jgi:hypothetical protein